MLAIIDIVSIEDFDNKILNNWLRTFVREDILRSIWRFDIIIVAITVVAIITIFLASLVF